MIGILALQGGFREHEEMLDQLGLAHRQVRRREDTQGLTGFIIPGGESTVIDLFMEKYGIKEWLMQAASLGMPIFGTCAGLILLARYGLLNATVQRNAYGRQLASFEANVLVKGVGTVRGHFIRAPKVTGLGKEVEFLAEWEGTPVVLRQGKVWAAAFHPELAGDAQLHAAVFSC